MARQSCAFELYLLQLGAKKTSLGVEDFQKTRIAILIAQVRKPQGSLQCLHLPVLRRLLFADLSRCNQSIFHFSETRLDGPEIVVQRLLLRGRRSRLPRNSSGASDTKWRGALLDRRA